MIKAMNTITSENGYPIFMPNQVLKNTDLNRLVKYLDAQNRLSRTYLIGMGIVCGMEVQSTYQLKQADQTAQAGIHISEGCGITSEGYVISLPLTTLTHYQSAKSIPAALFAPGQQEEKEAGKGSTQPLTYKILELFEKKTKDDRIALHLTPDGQPRSAKDFNDFLTDRVLVIVCESKEEQRDSCLVNYDDLGKDLQFNLRFFLLPRQTQETSTTGLSAETLLYQGFQMEELPPPWKERSPRDVLELRDTFFERFNPKVRRFGYSHPSRGETGVYLTEIKNYTDFQRNYRDVCQHAISVIDQEFRHLFGLFSPFFSSFLPPVSASTSELNAISGLKGRLEQALKAIIPDDDPASDDRQREVPYALQYFYDYLSQLVSASWELAEAAFDLMDDCNPDTRRFPKYLMLGLVPAPDQTPDICAVPSAYRTQFTQPPIYNGNHLRVRQVRHLYERLVRLCAEDSFYMLPFYDTPLKITPSKDRSVPLSEQAIPYYLNFPKLFRYWNYDDCRKGRSGRHPAYFFPKVSNKPFIASYDLLHRLDDYNFYRIEGHIGEASCVALERIKTYQQRYNLAFDVITLKLGEIDDLKYLNFCGQFDDLEAHFARMKDDFQKCWIKYEIWSQNVCLCTLKRDFFNKQSLAEIACSQLSNPILTYAYNPEAYQWKPRLGETQQPTGEYYLYLIDNCDTAIARFSFQNGISAEGDIFSFAGFQDEVREREQKRIIEHITAYMEMGKVTYEMIRDPDNALSCYLRLSTDETIALPSSDRQSLTESTSQRQVIAFIASEPFHITIQADRPSFDRGPFTDFQTLWGLIRDGQDSYDTESYTVGDRHALECLNYWEFKCLMETYQQRLKRLMALHSFHNFARYHPGMEHLGGVPKGGTFILVYVNGKEPVDKEGQTRLSQFVEAESQVHYTMRTQAIKKVADLPNALLKELATSRELLNRKDIVVADFCLPYRCCSDTPAVSYLFPQSCPVVLLEKTAFCVDDETTYEFILDPPGGVLKGEGSFLNKEDGKYYFQPSRIEREIVTELPIAFIYCVNCSYDTLTVILYPKPDANLSIEDKSSFCQNDPPIKIEINDKEKETFIELLSVTIDGQDNENRILNPRQYANDGSQEIEIKVKLRDRQTLCENTITRTVTVNPLPDAGFQVGMESSIEDKSDPTFHNNVERVSLNPNQGNGIFQALDGKDDITKTVITVIEDNQFFLPNKVNLKGQEKVITILYRIKDQNGCSNETQQNVRIIPAPNVDDDNPDVIDKSPDADTQTAEDLTPTDLINRRMAGYRNELETLGESDRALRESRLYEHCQHFLTVIAESTTEADAMRNFKELTNLLLESYRMSGDNRKDEVNRMLAPTTASLLDCLAIGTLTDDLINQLSEIFTELQASNMDLAAVKATWNPEELRTVVNNEILDCINEFMPE